MITRNGLTVVTSREQFAARRAEDEYLHRQDRDDRSHGIFMWGAVIFALMLGLLAGYLLGHARIS